MGILTGPQIKARLNKMSPTARDAFLGDLLYDMIASLNTLINDTQALRNRFNATNAKLDADVGVNDTNYAALNNAGGVSAATITLPEAR